MKMLQRSLRNFSHTPTVPPPSLFLFGAGSRCTRAPSFRSITVKTNFLTPSSSSLPSHPSSGTLATPSTGTHRRGSQFNESQSQINITPHTPTSFMSSNAAVKEEDSSSSSSSLSPEKQTPGNAAKSAAKMILEPFEENEERGHDKKSAKIDQMTEEELKSRLDDFQDLFVEARLCIEDCQDSMETTYFDEEAQTAREAVDLACKAYAEIIGDLVREERMIEESESNDDNAETKRTSRSNDIRRMNGLKVEQLKGELELVLNGGH